MTGFIDHRWRRRERFGIWPDELIALNGGVVDAYLDNSGKVQGEITANTRYLVYGEKSDSPSRAILQQPTNQMFKEASSLGVETITLPEFLIEMGYKPQDRMVPLGTGTKAATFRRDRMTVARVGRRDSDTRRLPQETAPTVDASGTGAV